jgi:type II restriction/modification system DNA methylase subunit YeeA
MNKTAIKNYAVWARKKLIEDIKQRAYEIGITEERIKEPEVIASDTMILGDISLNKVEMEQRKNLVSRMKEKGFNNVIEEVAYTWFNRILALRFMEVNGYLPTGVRVLSSTEPGRKEPDIIKESLNVDLDLDRDLVYKLQDENDTEALYRYLLVKHCNALKEILLGLFNKIEDYTEILLPSNLLAEGSVISQLVNSIPEEDFKDQVEIIGWMYQYYISEKKDEVFEGLRKNIKISKENIPAATQLFTPKWIVKYMVENSLGRLWLEGHPNEVLKSKWKYYLEEAEQEPEVQKQLEEIRAKSRDIKPENIKILDPAMGSGHILVYAFDVLYDIYKSEGYSERDIPRLILENNLYGLEIDDRAAQLAYFALMMKARSKSRRIFREKVNLNVCAIQESNGFPKEAIEYLINPEETEIEKRKHREDVEYLINVFHDAKEYGSILEVKPVDFNTIERRLEEIRNGKTRDLFEYQHMDIILKRIPPLVKQAKIMSQKYDVVVTNPPYMGSKGMNGKLSEFLRGNYPDSKSDLFAAFMEVLYVKQNGMLAMINQHSWMFLSSFEKLREKVILTKTIINMLHLGPRAFEEIGGEVVQSTAFILRNRYVKEYKSVFIRLIEIKDAQEKEDMMLSAKDNENVYFIAVADNFKAIPGVPIAYWVSERIRQIFKEEKTLDRIAEPKQGTSTGDNDIFLRLWFEVKYPNINFYCKNELECQNSKCKWYPATKGGDYRKWYGNNEFVVNWFNNGQEIKNYPGSAVRNKNIIFRKALTWTGISSSSFGVRYCPNGYVFTISGKPIICGSDIYLKYVLAFLCTKISYELLKILSPTMSFEVGYICKLPLILEANYSRLNNIVKLVDENITISKYDWDSFETSWDFKVHPFLNKEINPMYLSLETGLPSKKIESAFKVWQRFTEIQFARLKANEEELNRIFIEIYGLQDELTPEVEDKDITIRKANKERDIKSFISYAVGCMFGRYSIDAEGLIYAGGDFKDKWKNENGQWKVRKIIKDEEGILIEDTWVDAAFVPDMDNVLPITDEEYFEDDIVSRFIEFLKVTFGEDILEENLDYIADAIGRKPSETSRQAIRRYFLRDFYKDHVQVYKKRPIYWLFDSGKQDGFKALIYMHRYDEFTVARVRTDYLHKLQKSYESEIKRLDIIIDSDVSQREKTNARKKKERILRQMEECMQYDQVIAHVANQRIKIDLDDGVKVNYAKFQGIEIPQGEGRKPLKADLLAKI